MTSFEQLQRLDQLGVDFAGLIFYENSKRFVGNKLAVHKSQIRNLEIEKVGVFVNAEIDEIKKEVKEYGLNYVQLHGNESAEFCKAAKNFITVIKAIRINEETDLSEQLQKFENSCDYFLFDTDSKQYGGTGKQFNWEILKKINIKKKFFLSGGIGLQDIKEVTSFHHKMLFALDVNSRFETTAGIKNLEQVESFLKQIKLIEEDAE
jgi:phosphoribosylanthranilate isomerase